MQQVELATLAAGTGGAAQSEIERRLRGDAVLDGDADAGPSGQTPAVGAGKPQRLCERARMASAQPCATIAA